MKIYTAREIKNNEKNIFQHYDKFVAFDDIDFELNHQPHVEIKIEDGKITSFSPLEDRRCYVCDVLSKIRYKLKKAEWEKKQSALNSKEEQN